eukprot:TRINITY_DN12240_c0_g1_i2.p6 TRINITY_DN12240_c0_g1~~TRINITY_DN12240_c0_g1_i2.p6  ORF type:complete len:107 (+),score=3.80 TRINITY_DN12240_c0_g1_i2:2-322(+)
MTQFRLGRAQHGLISIPSQVYVCYVTHSTTLAKLITLCALQYVSYTKKYQLKINMNQNKIKVIQQKKLVVPLLFNNQSIYPPQLQKHEKNPQKFNALYFQTEKDKE